MESIKTCNVCFLNYDTKDHAPRSLPCGHTICSNCLINILKQPTLRKCPFDNSDFTALQNALTSFPLNFVLMDLLEQKINNTCKTHDGEKLKFICLTDQTKICSECAKHKSHKKHKIKRIKELKAQGAKVKRELQESLGNLNTYEQEKADDFEQIRKVFITAIDEQVKEVKHILVEKQCEWVQQMNNIFDADKKHDSEGLLGLKQQMNETIKNITHACQDENGDLMLLNKEANNTIQKIAKKRPQFLKDKSSRVQEKFLEMQKSLQESLENSRIAINSLFLTSQDVVKEIYSVKEESEQLSQEEFTKIHRNLRSIKFMSHYEIEIDSGCLNISFQHSQQKELEINLDDFQGIEKIHLQDVRCDMLKNEPRPDAISYIFHGLKNLVNLTVTFDPQNFYNEGLSWLGNIIQHHVGNLKRIELYLPECKFDDESMPILCDKIFSKARNLDSFTINLDACQIIDADLEILIKSMEPIQRYLKFFALVLRSNNITESGIDQIFEVTKRMEKLQVLHLYLPCADMTDESFKKFGESVLPSLKGLDCLGLCLNESVISDEVFCTILKNLPNLKGLRLYLSKTLLTDKALEMFIGEVLPRLELSDFFHFEAEGTQMSKENLQKIQEISASLEKKRASDDAAN